MVWQEAQRVTVEAKKSPEPRETTGRGMRLLPKVTTYFRTFVDVNPVTVVPEPGSAAIFGVFVLGACMSKCFRKGLSAD